MSSSQTSLGNWKQIGLRVPLGAQIFAIGDVHGQADTLEAVLSAIKAVPRTADVRRLVFIGDLIDRGPASLRAIALTQRARELAGVEDVVALPGNHELMLLDGIDAPQMHISDWLDNGGDAVIEEAQPVALRESW